MAPESLDPQLALPAGYPRAPTTSAHTYRLQIFKEQAERSPGSCESFQEMVQQRGAIIGCFPDPVNTLQRVHR